MWLIILLLWNYAALMLCAKLKIEFLKSYFLTTKNNMVIDVKDLHEMKKLTCVYQRSN